MSAGIDQQVAFKLVSHNFSRWRSELEVVGATSEKLEFTFVLASKCFTLRYAKNVIS